MPSRLRDLLRPRALALLAAGLLGSSVASRVRPSAPGRDDEPPSRSHQVPTARFEIAILAACGLVAAGYLLWTEYRARAQGRAVAVALTGGDPDRAPALLIRYGCAGCHTIPGVPGANGKVAAPLAGLRARVYVAGVLPNTADNLIAWIVDPPAFSPRTAMPVTGITEEETRDVAAYLYTR